MPATQVPVQNPVGPYPTLPVAPTSLDIAFTAVDAVNGNFFSANQISVTLPASTAGGDILLVNNPTGGALTITFTSQPLNGRSGDITTYSVGAGLTSAFKYSQLVGWQDANNNVFFTAAAGLLVAVLQR